MTQASEQQRVRQYLLGELRDAEQCRVIEERLLTDNDFCEQIEIAEDELIEQYLDGELSESEQMRFEQYFLNTKERRQKFSVARSINRYATSQSAPTPANEAVEPDTIKTAALQLNPGSSTHFGRVGQRLRTSVWPPVSSASFWVGCGCSQTVETLTSSAGYLL